MQDTGILVLFLTPKLYEDGPCVAGYRVFTRGRLSKEREVVKTGETRPVNENFCASEMPVDACSRNKAGRRPGNQQISSCHRV